MKGPPSRHASCCVLSYCRTLNVLLPAQKCELPRKYGIKKKKVIREAIREVEVKDYNIN